MSLISSTTITRTSNPPAVKPAPKPAPEPKAYVPNVPKAMPRFLFRPPPEYYLMRAGEDAVFLSYVMIDHRIRKWLREQDIDFGRVIKRIVKPTARKLLGAAIIAPPLLAFSAFNSGALSNLRDRLFSKHDDKDDKKVNTSKNKKKRRK